MKKVSALTVADLSDMALPHSQVSILLLCQEPIPSLVCPQPKKVGEGHMQGEDGRIGRIGGR